MHLKQVIFLLSLAALLVGKAQAEEACQSFRDAKGRSKIDFAPLAGFVEVCSQDGDLCHLLSKGYPPSVETLAYFVTTEDWARYQLGGTRSGFSRYLIGQRTRRMTPDEFSNFRRYIHSQQGSIPDHTQLPQVLASHGRVPLGIIDESDDSISFGVIMKLSAQSDALSSFYLSSVNIALQRKEETLALYAFDSSKDADDGTTVKRLAKKWLSCIRRRNP